MGFLFVRIVENKDKYFDLYFRGFSYLGVLSGLLALYFGGGIGISVATLFTVFTAISWRLENTRWQITERIGVGILICVVPLIIFESRLRLLGTGLGDTFVATDLARLILFLCAIKLLQKKSDRDWVFIYLISFFMVLLAAGLSISAQFVVALIAYLLFTISAIIAFEIRKSSAALVKRNAEMVSEPRAVSILRGTSLRRLPLFAAALMFFITLFAVPLFFMLPRVGGAGYGSALPGGGALTGFSDSVTLGEIGKLKRSDKPVMRISLEAIEGTDLKIIYWRGVALDRFDGIRWTKSRRSLAENVVTSSNGYFPLNSARQTGARVTQRVYLEPIGSQVLFALSRPLALRGQFGIVRKGRDDTLKAPNVGFNRTTYSVISEPAVPDIARLRRDNQPYRSFTYLQLPTRLDRRISRLASRVVRNARARSRYDKAKAIERFLDSRFDYSLDMEAQGPDPLSDFLFNVKAGHCEYFSSAMAIMLRTQGIASRVVNGFQRGEYNKTAEMYVVKQWDAHSWVEVYFPETRSWITFDPTPAAGQFNEMAETTLAGRVRNYFEALEAIWIQYFVSYDSQEQRSLFQSAQDRAVTYKQSISKWIEALRIGIAAWWSEVKGSSGYEARIKAIGIGLISILALAASIILVYWLYRKVRRLRLRDWLARWRGMGPELTSVEFYQRLQKILETKGVTRPPHKTPMEVAFETGITNAVKVTEKYNIVRFGGKHLTKSESSEIEIWLNELESGPAVEERDIVQN